MAHVPPEYGSSRATLVYAMDTRGRVVHVSTVPRGAACACTCPDPLCGSLLVARKGEKTVHHFGHIADRACGGGVQSAIHRLAKQLVEDKKLLHLPAVTASYRDQMRTIHEARLVTFDRVEKEFQDLKQIVPDIFALKSNRRLLIEFAVTHPCDKEKVSKIRAKGIAALEIDLSKVPRDASPKIIERAVTEIAPRHWLYHPSIDAAVTEMRLTALKEVQLAADQLSKKVELFSRDYLAGVKELQCVEPIRIENTDEIARVGFTEHIGTAIDGNGCFAWSPSQWQIFVWREFLIPRGLEFMPCRTDEIMKRLKTRKALRARFRYVPEEIEDALVATKIGFLSPYKAIQAYLERLVRANIVLKAGNGFILATRFSEEIEILRKVDKAKEVKINEIVSRATKILMTLPESEREAISAEKWVNQRLENFKISFVDAINVGDSRFEQMSTALLKIERMMFKKGASAEDLLGLPITRERERQRTARQKEENDRKAAEEVARVARIEQITTAAQKLGDDATVWLTSSSVNGLDGRSPLVAAEAAHSGLERALAALGSELSRREDERERQARIQAERKKQAEKVRWFQGQLREQAERALGKDKGPLFLRSPYAELGRKRPIEFCKDRDTLNISLGLLKKVARG